MKKHITFLLAALISASAAAEPAEVKLDIICASDAEVEQVLTKFEEIPMMVMSSTRQAGEQKMDVPTILFANPKTRTWTLIERPAENLYCVIGSGKGIAPFVMENKEGKGSQKSPPNLLNIK